LLQYDTTHVTCDMGVYRVKVRTNTETFCVANICFHSSYFEPISFTFTPVYTGLNGSRIPPRLRNYFPRTMRILEIYTTTVRSPINLTIALILKSVLRFELLTSVVIKCPIFWDITQCSPLNVDQSFGGTCCRHVQGRRTSQEMLWLLSASCWLLGLLILQPQRLRHVPPNLLLNVNGLHGAVTQTMGLFDIRICSCEFYLW
jgi:hypothetical protein